MESKTSKVLYMAGKKTFDEMKNNQNNTDDDDAYLEKVDDDDNIIDMPEK